MMRMRIMMMMIGMNRNNFDGDIGSLIIGLYVLISRSI
jgi:hypothetical protein